MILKKTCLAILVGTTLVLSGCGSDSGGGESTPTQEVKATKAQRLALKAEDITRSYYDSLEINPFVDNVMGTLSFRIIDSSPENIAQIDSETDRISVFNTGTLTVEVTDTSTVFENSTVRFTVTIEKGTNNALITQPKFISLDSTDSYVQAENNKGTVTYRVADESLGLLDIDPESGELIPRMPGTAKVIVEDAGNEKYAPASTTANVTIKELIPGKAECADVTASYSEGLVLESKCLSTNTPQYSYNIATGNNIDHDVINIDAQSGRMTVNKVGSTVVEVTVNYDVSYGYASEKLYFDVNILKGKRQNVKVEGQTLPYSAWQIIQPNVSNNVGKPVYEVENGNDVITINKTTGYPQIVGVGTANLRVTDNSNSNYPPSTGYFSYTVNKAAHPGLKSDTEIKRTYAHGLKITPHIDGQQGKLTITSDSPKVSITGDNIVVKKAGKIELKATDSGGELYQLSKPVSLVLDIARASHPALTVTGLTSEYKPGCISIRSKVEGNRYADGSEGKIVVTDNSDESVAVYSEEGECITLLKAGVTNLSLHIEASDNYEASASVILPVIVNKVGATLNAAGDVTGAYTGAMSTIQTSQVTGAHGELTYEIKPGSATDVVEISDNVRTYGGAMKVLNAGKTTIMVTASGNEQYEGSSVYFNVIVAKAANPLSVAYPDEVFKSGKSILPTLENSVDDMKTTFELISGDQTVDLVNASTGALTINAAGDYSLKVIASSRNYKQKELIVSGVVKKAPHPGLDTPTVSVEYVPLKKYPLTIITQAKGKRTFAIDSSETKGLAEIDPNTGELTLLDFIGDETELVIAISEEGDQNFEGIEGVQQRVIIKAPGTEIPENSVLRRDFTMAPLFTFYSSRLNNNVYFNALKETKVSFAGVRTLESQETQKQTFGPGLNLLIPMKPVDETATLENTEYVMVYAQRYDGCGSSYAIDNIAENIKDGSVSSVSMDSDDTCPWGIQRYLTLTVVKDSLTPGEWEAVTPFVIYRHSDLKFKPTTFGGCYVTANSSCTGKTESESNIQEWSRVDLRLTKD